MIANDPAVTADQLAVPGDGVKPSDKLSVTNDHVNGATSAATPISVVY